jgi:hypothetical protein
LRLLCLPLLLIFVPLAPVDALGKGGTNMHELANTRATVPTYQSPFPNEVFGAADADVIAIRAHTNAVARRILAIDYLCSGLLLARSVT